MGYNDKGYGWRYKVEAFNPKKHPNVKHGGVSVVMWGFCWKRDWWTSKKKYLLTILKQNLKTSGRKLKLVATKSTIRTMISIIKL